MPDPWAANTLMVCIGLAFVMWGLAHFKDYLDKE